MCDKHPVHLPLVKGNAGKGTIDHNQPIAVFLWVDATENIPPGKLSLSTKVGGDHPVVKSAPLGVFRSIRSIEWMDMTQENAFYAIFASGYHLDLKAAKVRFVDSQEMLVPSRDGERIGGDLAGGKIGQQLSYWSMRADS
jgi:hypothetical protein